jgi:acylphosphatase
MASAHLLVSGRVQGVGFRWFVRVAGRKLQLSGWVKNRADGTVEIAAEGSEDRLAELRAQVSRGPDGAVVSEIVDLEPVAEALEFPFVVRK